MEEGLQDQIKSVSNEPGVLGVVCFNKQGLVLCKEGSVTDSLAYNISLLAKHSASLEDDGPSPVTCVEFNNLKIVMKQTEKVVFAIISESV
ncbi:hypothetical protein ACHWQZ_G008431 [Mnemiopsis leidyi]